MNRKQWLILLGIAMVALTIVPVFLFEKRLEHTGGPGILAFEFAATKARASQILAEWGPKGRHTARLSLIVDYAYMVSYGGFFTLAGLATRDLARTRDWRRVETGRSVALRTGQFGLWYRGLRAAGARKHEHDTVDVEPGRRFGGPRIHLCLVAVALHGSTDTVGDRVGLVVDDHEPVALAVEEIHAAEGERAVHVGDTERHLAPAGV